MSWNLEEFFAECLELGVCSICYKNTREVFLFPIPGCEHRICEACCASPPPECSTCKVPYDRTLFTPDLCFKAIWDSVINDLDERTFNRLIEECQTNSVSLAVSKTPVPSTSRISRTPTCDSSGKPKYLKRNRKGETVLHELCSLGFAHRRGFCMKKLQEMLADGANPNTLDGGGITPLHESIIFENLSIMKTLLDGGAQVNCYSNPPGTPLHTAVEKYEHCGPDDLTTDSIPYQIITTLLDYGADKNLIDCFKRTPCNIAANNPALLKLLNEYQPMRLKKIELPVPEPPMVVLCITENNKNALDDLKQFETRFKVKCLPEQRGFKPTVTHLVIPEGAKKASHRIRMAILSGCFVITMQWVRDSLRQDSLLPAERYEVPWPLVPDSKAGYVSRAARLEKQEMRPRLFVGGDFYVMPQGIEANRRKQINELIQTGGGVVLTREPKPSDHGEEEPKLFHAPIGSMWEHCSVIILYAQEPRAVYQMRHIKHVPITWFLDCIDTYTIREQ